MGVGSAGACAVDVAACDPPLKVISNADACYYYREVNSQSVR